MMPDTEYVTVSELAKVLGLSERQAARWVARVSDTDRLTSDIGPTRVRLASVMQLRQKPNGERFPPEKTSDTSFITSDASPKMTDTRQTHVSHEADTTSDAVGDLLRELEKERSRSAVLEAEKKGLEARLTDTQEDRDAWKAEAGTYSERLGEALRALQQAQDEARAARLLPSGRSAALIASQETAGGDSTGASAPGGASAPSPRPKRWWPFSRGN